MTLMSLSGPISSTVGAFADPTKKLMKKINGSNMIDAVSSSLPPSLKKEGLSDTEEFLTSRFILKCCGQGVNDQNLSLKGKENLGEVVAVNKLTYLFLIINIFNFSFSKTYSSNWHEHWTDSFYK